MYMDEKLAKQEREEWLKQQKKPEMPPQNKSVEEYREELLRGEVTFENVSYKSELEYVLNDKLQFWFFPDLTADKTENPEFLAFRYEKLDFAVNIANIKFPVKVWNVQEFKNGIRNELKKNQMNITWMEEEGKIKSGRAAIQYCTGAVFSAVGYIMQMFFFFKLGDEYYTGNFSCPYSRKELYSNLLKAYLTLLAKEE